MENPRGRILDEAAALFARDGYDGASLGDVADAVGVTKAAIYHYFPNKKEIYEAIIVRTLEGLLKSVVAAIDKEPDAEEALSRFMTAHADYFEKHYYGFVTMLVGYGGMENIAMIEEAQKLRNAYEALLRDIVAAGVRSGRFRKVDVNITSRAILSMLNWMVRWYKPGRGRPAAYFAKEYCNLVVGGVRETAQFVSEKEPVRSRKESGKRSTVPSRSRSRE